MNSIIMVGFNALYYVMYAIEAHRYMVTSNGESRMLIFSIMYLFDECVLIILGYVLLLLRQQVGRAVLLLFYIGKVCLWGWNAIKDVYIYGYFNDTDAIRFFDYYDYNGFLNVAILKGLPKDSEMQSLEQYAMAKPFLCYGEKEEVYYIELKK